MKESMTRTQRKPDPGSEKGVPVVNERASLLVVQALVDALADPFTDVHLERYPDEECPLCGKEVFRPTRKRPNYKCRGRGTYDEPACGWTGKEPVRTVTLTIRATTRNR